MARLLDLPTEVSIGVSPHYTCVHSVIDTLDQTLDKIGSYLPSADDILRYAFTCKRTLNVVYDARAPLWRAAFAELYDLPAGKTVTAIRAKCVQRDILRCRTVFKLGNGYVGRGRFEKY